MDNTNFVLTDSAGIQEETTILNIPCITLRKNTERPITVKKGTNIVVGTAEENIVKESLEILKGSCKVAKKIKLWDGKAFQRIIKVLKEKYNIS